MGRSSKCASRFCLLVVILAFWAFAAAPAHAQDARDAHGDITSEGGVIVTLPHGADLNVTSPAP